MTMHGVLSFYPRSTTSKNNNNRWNDNIMLVMIRITVLSAVTLSSYSFSTSSFGLCSRRQQNVHSTPSSDDFIAASAPSRLCRNMVNTAMNPSYTPASNYSDTSETMMPYFKDLTTPTKTTTVVFSQRNHDVLDMEQQQQQQSGYNRGRGLLDDDDDESECVEAGLVEYCPSDNEPLHPQSTFIEGILSTYIGPRIILGLVAVLYGTNFPLGAIMNDNLPASAATSSRMVLASLALSPFLLQLKPSLRTQVFIGGAFVSMGYISQSVALIDTSPALVSFLGSTTVLVCPILQWLVDKKPMGIKDVPQTWMAAVLCLSGVATLELFDAPLSDSISRLGVGDALSLLQAVGFGTGCFMSEKMMKREPDQALPITAGLVTVTAFFAMLWCLADDWMHEPGWQSMGLPGLFFDPDMRTVAIAVAWTGILSTSINFWIEITALGRVPSAEASVILATEPLWASLFAALLFHEQFGMNDYIGGLLMISACLVNTWRPSDIRGFFSRILEPTE